MFQDIPDIQGVSKVFERHLLGVPVNFRGALEGAGDPGAFLQVSRTIQGVSGPVVFR